MKLTEKIGRNIKSFRIAKKMSQEELAHLTETYQSQIHRFESGKQPINSDYLQRFSEALNIPAIEFLKSNPEIHKGFDNQQLIEILYQMPEDKKKELTEILRKTRNYDFKDMKKAFDLILGLKEK